MFLRVGTWSAHRHNGVETVEIHFEPVAVRVLKEDGDQVVVSEQGQLKVGDTVAMNQAYELNLTYEVQMGQGDDGHGHPH